MTSQPSWIESPIRFLTARYTQEELAQQLWQAVQENIKLMDRNLRLEVENFWLHKELHER